MVEVRLAQCPPGLFETADGTWGFKTEYAHQSMTDGFLYPEAYVVESGEFFWGGATTHPERAGLLVRPLKATDLRAQLAASETRVRALEEALEPFALVSSEGVVVKKTGHVQVTTCAEYFHRASAIHGKDQT